MAGHRAPDRAERAEHHGPHEIHLPSPTIAPALIALGVTLIAFGILFGVVLVALGGAIFLVGLATWLINDAREYMRAGEGDGQGGH